MLLTGCATTKHDSYQLNKDHPSISYDQRIKSVVMHYTAVDRADSLKILTTGQVSAHYLVSDDVSSSDKKITVYQLVPEPLRAWHAGISFWRGRTGLNDTSIGIEIVNLGYRDNPDGSRYWYPFKPQQIAAVKELLQGIIQRYGIAPTNVVGHMDIAPQRKSDPGPLFPWAELAKVGIGAWPEPDRVQKYLAGRPLSAPANVKSLQEKLVSYGYQIPQNGQLDQETRRTIAAFQMHFRQRDFSGTPDAETEAIIDALLEQYGKA